MPCDVFILSFRTNWQSRKDYSFNVFCDLFIRDQLKFLDEGNLGGRQKTHFPKGKGQQIYKDRGCVDSSSPRQECLN